MDQHLQAKQGAARTTRTLLWEGIEQELFFRPVGVSVWHVRDDC